MDNRQLVELITAEVVKALKETGLMDTGSSANYGDTDFGSGLLDIASKEYKDSIQIADPENQLAINAMRKATTARVGIGRSEHEIADFASRRPCDGKGCGNESRG